MTDIPWNTTRLKKYDGIFKRVGNYELSVSHADRTIDPYLAGVVLNGFLIYTGLHATLADARRTVEEKSK